MAQGFQVLDMSMLLQQRLVLRMHPTAFCAGMELQVIPIMPLLDTVLLPECQDSWETEDGSQPPCCTSMLSASVHYRVLICLVAVLSAAQIRIHTCHQCWCCNHAINAVL